MNSQVSLFDVMMQNLRYRDSLIKHREKVLAENPDKLENLELAVLSYKIYKEIQKIDDGLPEHLRSHVSFPNVPPFDESEEFNAFSHYLFGEFVDWFDLIPTISNNLLTFVLNRYPVDTFPNIVCVGDGQFCHLGRKLAQKGYKALSIDPEINTNVILNDGKFHRIDREFSLQDEDIIRWANLIVGPKVPQCTEIFLNCPKPTVFSISKNPEMYKMTVNGQLITSHKQLDEIIRHTTGVTTFKRRTTNPLEGVCEMNIYVHNGRVNDKDIEYNIKEDEK